MHHKSKVTLRREKSSFICSWRVEVKTNYFKMNYTFSVYFLTFFGQQRSGDLLGYPGIPSSFGLEIQSRGSSLTYSVLKRKILVVECLPSGEL